MRNVERRDGVQAIARAAAILRRLEAAPGGLALGDLAEAAGLAKSTVHRLVGALGEEGMTVRGPDGKVHLGPALTKLGAASQEATAAQLRPLLVALRRRTDETVDLGALDGSSVRFLDQVAAPHRLRAVSAVGELFPLHCTANGKALLAAMPEERVAELLPKRLPRLTARTVATRRALLEELEEVRRTGVAFDREEHSEGICAVGAAVPGGATPTVAISIPVPIQRFEGREDELAGAVRETAEEAAAQLSGGEMVAVAI
jgi:DNA-binding IclR family transcriptional regulator